MLRSSEKYGLLPELESNCIKVMRVLNRSCSYIDFQHKSFYDLKSQTIRGVKFHFTEAKEVEDFTSEIENKILKANKEHHSRHKNMSEILDKIQVLELKIKSEETKNTESFEQQKSDLISKLKLNKKEQTVFSDIFKDL